MITHDSHVAEEAGRTVHLADGRIANGGEQTGW